MGNQLLQRRPPPADQQLVTEMSEYYVYAWFDGSETITSVPLPLQVLQNPEKYCIGITELFIYFKNTKLALDPITIFSNRTETSLWRKGSSRPMLDVFIFPTAAQKFSLHQNLVRYAKLSKDIGTAVIELEIDSDKEFNSAWILLHLKPNLEVPMCECTKL